MSKFAPIKSNYQIFNEENLGYVKEIEEKSSIKFFLFKKIDEAIDYISGIEGI